ncbi:MAG TPA: gephyrin-like molybdotransferase Glp [Actinomycetes bacterium]|nr:gephyrin-like molybdotransferase Glp [Actinomycetes bacterium]
MTHSLGTSARRTPAAGEPLASVEEVAASIEAAVAVLPATPLPLAQAAGRVLAEAVRAPMPLPRFDNAAMDGYAVRTADVAGAAPDAPVTLRLVAPSAAGQAPPPELPAGCACPIATGAPLPAGADAVIMLEHAVEHDGKVLVSEPAGRGQHVRRRGEDVPAGSELLHVGHVLTAGQIVAAAALGRTTLQVRRLPRIATVLTGTEVVPAGRPLADHQVFDAVGPALQALLADVGCVTATLGPLDDDCRVLAATLLDAAEDSDALITVGGASVGRHDHLKQVLRRHGELHTRRVALRPAKPFVFGAIAGTPLFGLPGNPASALAAYEVFVRPALDGRSRRGRPPARRLPGRGLANAGLGTQHREVCWSRPRHPAVPVQLIQAGPLLVDPRFLAVVVQAGFSEGRPDHLIGRPAWAGAAGAADEPEVRGGPPVGEEAANCTVSEARSSRFQNGLVCVRIFAHRRLGLRVVVGGCRPLGAGRQHPTTPGCWWRWSGSLWGRGTWHERRNRARPQLSVAGDVERVAHPGRARRPARGSRAAGAWQHRARLPPWHPADGDRAYGRVARHQPA